MLFFGVPAVFAAWLGGGYLGLAIEGLFKSDKDSRKEDDIGMVAFMLFFGPAIGGVTAGWLWW